MLFSLLGLPQIISSVLNFATPLLSSALGFLGWYLKNVWDGSKVILANLSTLTVILTVAVIAGVYGAQTVECSTTKEPVTIEKTSKSETNWWDDVFRGR